LAAEWPSFTWVDDNFLLQLIPLILVYLVDYFHPEVMG
jgi:hypothetical protein